MSRGLVSVIIPTYNRKDFLEEALKSVINQTYSNIEILVIDDGSKTSYAEAISKRYSDIKYHWKENGGISSARNFGIEKANGDFIAFLDDDDLWKPHKLEKQLEIFENNKDVDLVHSSAEVIDEEGNLTGNTIGASKKKSYKRSGYVFWNALGTWLVKSPTPLIRKRVFESNLRFDETIKSGEDMDFYNRLFFKHKVYYISKPLAYYRIYKEQKRLSLQTENYKNLELKIYNNLINENNISLFKKYRISRILLEKFIKNKRALNEKIPFSFIEKYFFPIQKINSLLKNAQR